MKKKVLIADDDEASEMLISIKQASGVVLCFWISSAKLMRSSECK